MCLRILKQFERAIKIIWNGKSVKSLDDEFYL